MREIKGQMKTHQVTELSKLMLTTVFKLVTVKPLEVISIMLSRDIVKNI